MRRSTLTAAIRVAMAAGLLASAQAWAQQSPEPAAQPQAPSDAVTLDGITVTGIRGSLAKSVAAKRSADIVSDTIAAEDIGKFPTQNLADSLQRITGIQIQRSRGEGSAAAVRGMPSSFTQVIYNGRPIAGTGRSFDFSILSSSFVNALSAYKTPVADMREGGLAATINVETVKPLSLKQRTVTATVEGIHEGNAGQTKPHVSALYADQFLDDRFGIAIGVDASQRSIRDEYSVGFGFEQRNETSTDAAGQPVRHDLNRDGDFNDKYRFAHGAGLARDQGTRERRSVMAALQLRPTDSLELRSDILYSKLKTDTFQVGNILRFTNQIGPNQSVDWEMDPGSENSLVYLDANGVDHRNNGRGGLGESTLTSYALGANWAGERWTVDGELGLSRVKSESTSLSLEVLGRASASYDFRNGRGQPPVIAFNRGYDPLNPNNFRATSLNGGYKSPSEGKVDDARLDFSYEVGGWLKRVKFGATWDRRQYDYGNQSVFVNARQLAEMLGVPYDPTLEGGSFSGAPWMRDFGGFLTSDLDLLFRDLPLDQILSRYPATTQLSGLASLREENTGLYVRADFEAFDGRLSGNVGLRQARTRQLSTGYTPNLDEVIFRDDGSTTLLPDVTLEKLRRSYDELLPSLNLRYDISEQWVARLGAARVLSRPDIGVLLPRTSIDVNVKNISSGNPNVEPYLADQFDLALEWYFNPESLLSATAFYKDLKSLIVSGTTFETRTIKLEEGGTRVVEFSRFLPVNGSGVKVKGLELGYQQPFSFLPAPWDGFGAMANYTYIDAGEVRTTEDGPLQPFTNVSKNSYNAILYYEKPRFGVYAAYNYRSGFVGSPDSYFGDGDYTRGYGQIDLSGNYKINDHFSLNLAVTNLTDEPVETYNRFGFSRSNSWSGRRIVFGGRFNF